MDTVSVNSTLNTANVNMDSKYLNMSTTASNDNLWRLSNRNTDWGGYDATRTGIWIHSSPFGTPTPLFSERLGLVKEPEIPSCADILNRIVSGYDPIRYLKKLTYHDHNVHVEKWIVDEEDVEMPKGIGYLDYVKNSIVCQVEDYYKNKYNKHSKEGEGMTSKEINEKIKQFHKWSEKICQNGGSVQIDNIYAGCIPDVTIKTTLNNIDFEKCCCGKDGDIPKVVKVESYNNRVVKVTFADGTFAKSVCSENDTFDLDVGITICVMKKMLGEKGTQKYNNMLRDIHSVMENNEKAKEQKKKEKEERKAKQKKLEQKRIAGREAARQEYIDDIAAGVSQALKERDLKQREID